MTLHGIIVVVGSGANSELPSTVPLMKNFVSNREAVFKPTLLLYAK